MEKLRVYLDTSVVSHLLQEDVPEKMADTSTSLHESLSNQHMLFEPILFHAELSGPLYEAALHSCMKYPLFLRYFLMFSRYNSEG